VRFVPTVCRRTFLVGCDYCYCCRHRPVLKVAKMRYGKTDPLPISAFANLANRRDRSASGHCGPCSALCSWCATPMRRGNVARRRRLASTAVAASAKRVKDRILVRPAVPIRPYVISAIQIPNKSGPTVIS
jgi:hypothetical protein